jgi:hypothetical protein
MDEVESGVSVRDPLFGVHLKLKRASQHLAMLDAEVSAWLAREPYTLYGEFEPWPKFNRGPNFGLYHLKFRDVDSVPPEWSVVLGDFLHNTRTALDHLVWQLVIDNRETPTRNTQFPICLAPEKFETDKKTRLRGVSDQNAEIIANTQPYAREDLRGQSPTYIAIEHPLAILKKLSNKDKHQVLNPTVAMVRNVMWSPMPTTLRDMNLPNGTDSYPGVSDTLTDGALLMSIVAERTGPSPFLDVGAAVGVEINLGRDAPNSSITAMLTAIRDEVIAIMGRFPLDGARPEY